VLTEKNSFDVDINQYPEVKLFFQQATEASKNGGVVADVTKNSLARSTIFGKTNADAGVWEVLQAPRVCGTWGNPFPTQAEPWKRIYTGNVNTLSDSLRGWGYHYSGDRSMGWTRPKNYETSYCGYSTFRDNAWIPTRIGSFYPLGYISEQYYQYNAPWGEPNPEIWTASKLPYPTWPAYVYWWHQTY
jgi:hypothetical protein